MNIAYPETGRHDETNPAAATMGRHVDAYPRVAA